MTEKDNNQSEQLIVLSNPKTTIPFIDFAEKYVNNNEEVKNFMEQLNFYLSEQMLNNHSNKSKNNSIQLLIKTSSNLNKEHKIDLINVVTLLNLEQDFEAFFDQDDKDIVDLLRHIKVQSKAKKVLIVDYVSTAIIDQ